MYIIKDRSLSKTTFCRLKQLYSTKTSQDILFCHKNVYLNVTIPLLSGLKNKIIYL